MSPEAFGPGEGYATCCLTTRHTGHAGKRVSAPRLSDSGSGADTHTVTETPWLPLEKRRGTCTSVHPANRTQDSWMRTRAHECDRNPRAASNAWISHVFDGDCPHKKALDYILARSHSARGAGTHA